MKFCNQSESTVFDMKDVTCSCALRRAWFLYKGGEVV